MSFMKKMTALYNQDVLITLAVINLDPENLSGVACKKIVAFLSLYFPYYNRNVCSA